MSTAEILANLYDSTRDEMGDSGAWDNVVRSEHFYPIQDFDLDYLASRVTLFKFKEVAAALGICLSTLEKNVKKGLFPPPIKHSLLRVGWLTADIENFLKGNKSQEQPDKNA